MSPPNKNPNEYIDFWQNRYEAGTLNWDLGEGSPHFARLLDENTLPTGKVAVLGCGRGHDAALFARKGGPNLQVTGFDYAPAAVAAAKDLYKDLDNLSFVEADIFNLDPSYQRQFDYLVEHTCYCAINPSRRDDYLAAVVSLLKPGGQLLGVFWDFADDGDGPPFPEKPEHLHKRFAQFFDILQIIPAETNAHGRGGQEYLAIMTRLP